MSISSDASNGSHPQGIWTLTPYLTPPLAASTAMFPVFYGFIGKSARQLGKPIPDIKLMEVVKMSGKAAPTIGMIVGTQMIVQRMLENFLSNPVHNQTSPLSAFTSMFASSIVVGTVSAPLLAIFNGQTMGRKVTESLQALTLKQSGAILARETSFLFSLRISDPVSIIMRQKLGDSQTVAYGSTFISGMIGSLIGHPADTALTLWQNGRKLMHPRQLMRGSLMRASASGGFFVGYKITKEWLGSVQQ